MTSLSNCTNIIFASTCSGCKTCPSNALYSLGTCNMKTGNFVDDTQCVCPAGMFYNSTLNICSKCFKCPANAWSFLECEENSHRDTTICRCKTGYYGNPYVRCLPCPKCNVGQDTYPRPNCGPSIQHESFIQGCQCVAWTFGYGCCIKGTYCLQNSSNVYACERGKYTPNDNMTACLQCPGLPIHYPNKTMATSCALCVANASDIAKVSCS